MCVCVCAVSYTHLDVYKRQMYEWKYIVPGGQAYLNYVMFTFPKFYYCDYCNKKAGRTHTHTIHVISGLTHFYFRTFARFLNGKYRNPHQHNVCKPKRCPAWTAICFLWIAGQCNCTCLQRNDSVSYTHLLSKCFLEQSYSAKQLNRQNKAMTNKNSVCWVSSHMFLF